jgi:hypothetical protein
MTIDSAGDDMARDAVMKRPRAATRARPSRAAPGRRRAPEWMVPQEVIGQARRRRCAAVVAADEHALAVAVGAVQDRDGARDPGHAVEAGEVVLVDDAVADDQHAHSFQGSQAIDDALRRVAGAEDSAAPV